MATNDCRVVLGYATVNDGGYGLFRYNCFSTAADDGGTIIAPNSGGGRWERIYSGAVDVRWFGAKGDNTTDDTFGLQSAIDAAEGKKVYIPLPTSKYRITVALTVPPRTHIIIHPQAVIRQDTNWTPVFDLLDTPDVTIEGGHLRYEGDRTYSPPDSFRGSGLGGYRAGVWTNSSRTVVRNLHVYGFDAGVSIAGWNTSINDHASYYVQDVVVENLSIDAVTWGVLAYGFDSLRIKNLRGRYINAPTGLYSTGGSHLVYISSGAGTTQNILNRGLDLDSAWAYNSSDGYAFQFKNVRGGTIGRLNAYNCPGVFTTRGCEDLSVAEIVSKRDLGQAANGSILVQDAATQGLKIGSANIDMSAAAMAFKIFGTECHVDSMRVSANRATTTGDLDGVLGGTRNTINELTYNNKGRGGATAVWMQDTDATVRNPDISGAQICIRLGPNAVRPVVEYDPGRLSVNSLDPSTPPIYHDNPTTPRIRQHFLRSSFSTTGGSAITLYPSLVTHAAVSVNSTLAFTISNPIVPIAGMELTYEMFHNCDGTMGVITWGTDFELNGAFCNPATGARKSITFRYDGAKWREVSRSA